jgi:hypothetical protein
VVCVDSKKNSFYFDFIKVVEIIDNVYKNGNETNLMEILCSPSHSDYFVAYLR